MSVTPSTITSAHLTATVADYYTAPTNTRSIVKKLTFTNSTGLARLVTVYLVPSGGVAGATNILIPADVVAPNTCYDCWKAVGQTLQAGGTIQAYSDLAAALTIQGAVAEVVQ